VEDLDFDDVSRHAAIDEYRLAIRKPTDTG
jgi:hypothetical protein